MQDKWYVLVSDDSGHEYVIPEDKEEEFYGWVDEELPDPPEWAYQKEGFFRFKQFEC